MWVTCGPNAWDRAKIKRGKHNDAPVLVCPAGADPYTYKWPVAGLDVTVIDTGAGDDALEALGHALLLDGASLVVLLENLGKAIVIFRREAISHAA